MKRFKNNKIAADTWVGMIIEPGAYYTIQITELFKWQNDSKVLTDLASGDGIINDGTDDILDVALAINFLKDTDSSPKDLNGSPLSRIKVTASGWAYKMHGFEFKTSQLDSIEEKKSDGTNYNFATIACYKDNAGSMVLCTDQADADVNCIMTYIDWEPTHDYEIIGGIFKQLNILTENVRLWVVGVPDIPAAYGGSKDFTSNVNLKYIGLEEGVKVDGRASKFLSYSATYHTNKLRLILKHPAGFKHPAHMIFEIFKA